MPREAIALEKLLPQEPAGMDFRVWVRHASGLEASCQPLAGRGIGEHLWPGKIRDMSPGGIGLVLSRRFEPEAALVIEIPATSNLPKELLLARVVHATAASGGFWLLGCSFLNQLSEDLFQRLAGLARPQDESPRRTAEFAVDRLTAVQSSGGQSGGRVRKTLANSKIIPGVRLERLTENGDTVRLQVGRLFLMGSWPLKAGTVITACVTEKKDQKTYGIRLKVSGCQEQEEGWTVHYSFVDPAGSDALRLFGHCDG
jgi:hypothetical protein